MTRAKKNMRHSILQRYLHTIFGSINDYHESIFNSSRYKVIGNNCQDWVEWLLSEIDPELARAMYERGVRKVSETFLGNLAKQQKGWTERLPSSISSSSLKGKIPGPPRRQHIRIQYQ